VYESELKPLDMSISEEKKEETKEEIPNSISRGGLTVLNYFVQSKSLPTSDIKNALEKIEIKDNNKIIKNNISVDIPKITNAIDSKEIVEKTEGSVLGGSVNRAVDLSSRKIKEQILIVCMLLSLLFGLKFIIKLK